MEELIPEDLNFLDRPEIIGQVAEQVIKDFEMFGLTIVFSGNAFHVYDELFEQVSKQLENLVRNDQQRFISILYRIDLSEQQVKKALDETPSRTFSAVIADLILRRRFRNH
jgi:hypothetical protein